MQKKLTRLHILTNLICNIIQQESYNIILWWLSYDEKLENALSKNSNLKFLSSINWIVVKMIIDLFQS